MSSRIDREALAQSLYFGHAVATYGPIAPNYKWYEPGVEQFNQFDPERRSRCSTRPAGPRGSGGIREKAGRSSPGASPTTTVQPTTKAIDQAMVAMLEDVGAEMKVKSPRLRRVLRDRARPSTLDNPSDASYGFEWLWSSPVDLLIFFHAFPSDAYNGSLPGDQGRRRGLADGRDDATLEAAAKQFQLAWAEKLPKIPPDHEQHLGRAEQRHGLHAARVHLYPLYNDVWLARSSAPEGGRAAARPPAAKAFMATFILRRALYALLLLLSPRCSSSTGSGSRRATSPPSYVDRTQAVVIESRREAGPRQAAGRRSTSSSSATCCHRRPRRLGRQRRADHEIIKEAGREDADPRPLRARSSRTRSRSRSACSRPAGATAARPGHALPRRARHGHPELLPGDAADPALRGRAALVSRGGPRRANHLVLPAVVLARSPSPSTCG